MQSNLSFGKVRRAQGSTALASLFLLGFIAIIIIVGTYIVGFAKDSGVDDLIPQDEVIDWEAGFLASSIASSSFQGTTLLTYLDTVVGIDDEGVEEQVEARVQERLDELLLRTKIDLADRSSGSSSASSRYIRVMIVSQGHLVACGGDDSDLFCAGAQEVGRISVDEWIERRIVVQEQIGGSAGYIVSPHPDRSAIIVAISPPDAASGSGRGQNPTGGVM